VCIFGINIILHSITSSHHSHNITSYIIFASMAQEGDTISIFGNCFEEVPRHKISFEVQFNSNMKDLLLMKRNVVTEIG
jgi:hypothetical protein